MICQVMSRDLQSKINAELKLLSDEMTKLCSKPARVVVQMLFHLGNPESTIPATVVADEVAQTLNDVNCTLEGRNALANKTDLRFS